MTHNEETIPGEVGEVVVKTVVTPSGTGGQYCQECYTELSSSSTCCYKCGSNQLIERHPDNKPVKTLLSAREEGDLDLMY